MAKVKTPDSLRIKPNGSYELRFMVDGKQYSVCSKDRKKLKELKEEKEKRLKLDLRTDVKSLTLDDYFKEWYDKRLKGGHIKPNSANKYDCNYYKHISPSLGKRKVVEIKKRDIEHFQLKLNELSKLEKGEKGRITLNTCSGIMKLLKAILNGAVEDEVILVSPAMNVKITKVTDKKATDTYHRALDSDEMKMFMDELKSDYYFEFIAFQYATGCRIGEVSALNWSDIDTKKNCIHITKTLTYTADGKAYIGDTPKTNAGIRDIPMNETIKAILESQKAKSSITPIGAVRIFNTVNGGLVYNYAINRAIKKCLKRLEAKGTPLEHLTSHFLRDTFATQFAKDTKDLQTLKTILGHNSLAMTSDLYAHVLDVTKQEAMEAINIDIVI